MMDEKSVIKLELYRLLLNRIDENIAALEHDVRELQLSANEETKSSAGDKYETGRAMVQIEIERLGFQLQDKIRSKQLLKTFQVDQISQHVQSGAIAETSAGNFFFLINGGEFVMDGKTFMIISIQAPLGKLLSGRMSGEEVTLNNRRITVKDVY